MFAKTGSGPFISKLNSLSVKKGQLTYLHHRLFTTGNCDILKLVHP